MATGPTYVNGQTGQIDLTEEIEAVLEDVELSVAWDDVTDKPSSFPAAWDDVTDKPSSFPAAAHDHTAAQVNVSAYGDGGISAGTLQAVLNALADRITDLELEGE